MGQEIVYCCRCQIQLRGKDFEKGAAFHVGGQVCCKGCVAEVSGTLPGTPVQPPEKAHPHSHSSTSQIPRVAGTSPEPTSTGWIPVLALVGVIGAVLLFVFAGGSDPG